MSFLIPKINSKNRKEALRAFKTADKDDAALDAMLCRDDIVIRDEIFAYVKGWRYKLYQRILNDPTHPYHAEAQRILHGEAARKKAEKESARKARFDAVINLRGNLNRRRELKDAVDAFVKEYEMTDEEKCALGECVIWLVGTWMIGDPDEKSKTLTKMTEPFFCLPFAKAHLVNSHIVFPKALCLKAADELKLDDKTRKDVYRRHKIADGRLVKPCDIGEHEYEYVKDVFEENYEDWGLSKYRALYRCKNCGREYVRDKS